MSFKQEENDEVFNDFALGHTNIHSQLYERSEIKQSECYYGEQCNQAILVK